jgi:hypothetical protein
MLLVFPFGRLAAALIPNWTIFGVQLNPGPFTVKEHVLVTDVSHRIDNFHTPHNLSSRLWQVVDYSSLFFRLTFSGYCRYFIGIRNRHYRGPNSVLQPILQLQLSVLSDLPHINMFE